MPVAPRIWNRGGPLMDADAEAAKLKALLAGVLIFLFSAFISFTELGYLLAGHTASARVVRVKDFEEYRRSGTRAMRAVEYEFTDNKGVQRRGSDRVDDEWPALREGQTVTVQYRAGPEGDTRLEG